MNELNIAFRMPPTAYTSPEPMTEKKTPIISDSMRSILRELALLRTLGARGGSLVRMLLIESLTANHRGHLEYAAGRVRVHAAPPAPRRCSK